MQISVFLSLMLNALSVAAKEWNSDDYVENYPDGYFTQWLSYVKRLSLAVLILSGAFLYYIPETRSYIRKGCCFLIDNIAEGLKTVLSLKESVINIDQKNTHHGSFISDRQSQNFYKNGNSEYVRHHKNVEESRQREEKKEKSKRAREKLKSDVHERSMNHNKDHHRYEKHNRSMKEMRESKRDKHEFMPSMILHLAENGNEYLIDDGSTESSPIYSIKNCTSYLISGSPQQMALLDEKDDVKIVVPSKLYPIKSKYDERSNRKVDDRANNGIFGGKELQKATCSVAKIISTAETVILNHSGLKSTCEVIPVEKGKRKQMTKDSGNKEAKVYYERTPRLKEKMNADFKYEEKCENVKETEKFLQSEEIDEKETKTTGTELLSELRDKINKLDLAIRMMRPSSKTEIDENGGKEVYGLQAVEVFLKDIKRSFREYDEGVKCREKLGTSRTILSRKNNMELDNKRKLRKAVQHRYIEDEMDKMNDQISRIVYDRRVIVSEDNHKMKERGRKKNNERISYKDIKDEDEFDDISEDEEIPLLTNIKPILYGAFRWLFSRCPHGQKKRLNYEENK